MAAFAIGEIESIKGADAILKIFQNTKNFCRFVRARAIEAAGKIAAANATAEERKPKELGEVILDGFEFEDKRANSKAADSHFARLTAVLRVASRGRRCHRREIFDESRRQNSHRCREYSGATSCEKLRMSRFARCFCPTTTRRRGQTRRGRSGTAEDKERV